MVRLLLTQTVDSKTAEEVLERSHDVKRLADIVFYKREEFCQGFYFQ